MIALDEALRRALEAVAALEAEDVALDEAEGRVLARDVVATHDQPPTRRSMMDGIAVAGDDARFRLVGEAAAGHPHAHALAAGEAVRIGTGGVVPEGADRVVPRELLAFDGETVRIEGASDGPTFIRPVGADFREGDVLLPAGARLHPGAIGAVAAGNAARVAVARMPKVRILTCGEELVCVGDEPGAAGAIDSAGPMVAALARRWGATVDRSPPIGDDPEALRQALEAARAGGDLVVTIGSASVGDHDHLRRIAREMGGSLLFERIAMKPGKPCWCARFDEGPPILGLPGNPGSAFVGAHLLLHPMLARMLGAPAPARRTARLAGERVEAGPRQTFLMARLEQDRAEWTAHPVGRRDSGGQAVLAACEALVDVPLGGAVGPGDLVSLVATGLQERF